MNAVPQRLSVNINAECADTLRRVMKARGISATEAIRRAIGLLDYFEKSAAPACANCGHPIAWHDPEEEDMCAKAACYCQKPEGHPTRLPCLQAGCAADAVLGGWCEVHQ